MQAKLDNSFFKNELMEKWLNNQLGRAIRHKKRELGIKIVEESKRLKAVKKEILDYLVEKCNNGVITLAKLSLCFDVPQLLEAKEFKNVFDKISKVWLTYLSKNLKIEQQFRLFGKNKAAAYLELPQDWEKALQSQMTVVLNDHRSFTQRF